MIDRVHPADEPGPPGRDHAGDHGGRRRRRGALLAPGTRDARKGQRRQAVASTDDNDAQRREASRRSRASSSRPCSPTAAGDQPRDHDPALERDGGGGAGRSQRRGRWRAARLRGAAAPRRRSRARGRDGHDRRPRPRHRGASTPAAPITVPVGEATLGRIFNVLGEPIDFGEELPAEVERWSIHQDAPRVEDLRRPPRCSRRGSRSSTCSRPTPRAARSGCSAAPASARPC